MRNLISISIVLLVALSSCKKLTQFELTYQTSFTIPSATGINLPTNIITPDIPTNSEATFAVNDTKKEHIEQILLREMSLQISSPSNGSFNFLKSIKIFINAEGLDEVKMAWKENITNTDAKSISLNVTCDDLQEFILKDNFDLRVETITDELLSSDYDIDMNSVFFVDANLRKK